MIIKKERFESSVLGYISEDTEVLKNGQLSFSRLVLFRLMKVLAAEMPEIQHINEMIEEWLKYPDCKPQNIFLPSFIALFFRFSDFETINVFMSYLKQFLDITEKKIIYAYSIAWALFKNFEQNENFDEEAFFFYLINNDAINKISNTEKNDFIKNVRLFLDNKECDLALTDTEKRDFLAFLSGVFEKKTWPNNLDPNLLDFLKETMDNFWWIIREYEQ